MGSYSNEKINESYCKLKYQKNVYNSNKGLPFSKIAKNLPLRLTKQWEENFRTGKRMRRKAYPCQKGQIPSIFCIFQTILSSTHVSINISLNFRFTFALTFIWLSLVHEILSTSNIEGRSCEFFVREKKWKLSEQFFQKAKEMKSLWTNVKRKSWRRRCASAFD